MVHFSAIAIIYKEKVVHFPDIIRGTFALTNIFRRASLLAFLRELGLHYVIRVCGNVWASTHKNAREKYSGILGEIRLRAGERKYLRNALYQKTLQVPTHLVLGRLKAEKGKKIEPWYIATDLDDLDKAYELYRKRFWIEMV
jgi:hypothetical protein